MDNKKVARKKVAHFFCDKCNYTTSKMSSWKKHLETIKHRRITRITKKLLEKPPFTIERKFICLCGKKYKYCSGLSKHKNKCRIHINSQITKKKTLTETIEIKDDSSDELKEIFKMFMKSQTEFNKKIANEITKPQTIYNDCHNNKMTINLFLNENCKDAMNLTDFVENLKITLEDLEFTKHNGYIEGMTNVFAKQLQDLKPTERPIHCSDIKRLQFYVKEDNKWEKDKNNEKIDDTLRNIKLKQTLKIGDWEKLHPNYREDPELLDEWQNMLAGITENMEGNVLKQKLALKRKIASYIELKDAMGLK
ncbi:MAG: hypothetical protein CL678_01985 [Bdellovibrionaceae bacterium]|nr:hypothetical protein [Pseudobdellovibrionaceae bacterium]